MNILSDKGDGHRLILCNDGGPLLGPTLEAPMGEEGLVSMVIEPLIDTTIDTLYWQLGTDPYISTPFHRHSDVYSHRTDVAPRFGADRKTFGSSGDWRIYENTRQLIEEGTDPPEVLIKRGHAAGLSVFLSMRFNDIHDGIIPGDDRTHLSPTKKEHPDWLLGPVSNPADPSVFTSEGRPFTGFSRYAYDISNPAVRAYKLALTVESIQNYDMDGMDWDLCRFPRLFPEGQAETNAVHLTDMLRTVRKALDEKGRQVGRKLLFSVRVPPTFKLAAGFGMDVRTWIDEGLIDILVAGVVHASMFRVPVEEYVEAARDTDIKVIAQNLGLFWTGRPQSARVMYHEPEVFTTEMCRASAASYWQAGVDGIYLWNNQLISFNRDIDYDGQQWKDIGDPRLLVGRSKHYLVDNPHDRDAISPEYGGATIPAGPLPVNLNVAGDSAEIPIDVGDDLASGMADGSLESAILRLMIVNLTAQDDVSFVLNGTSLDGACKSRRLLYDDCWLEFDVSDGLMKQGWNSLGLTVNTRNPYVAAPLKIESVEALVNYRD